MARKHGRNKYFIHRGCSQDGGQSKKMACASFGQSSITPKIMVEIASTLGCRGTLRPTSISFCYFDLGVTSHNLSLRGNLKMGGGGI